ncbi:MAG: DUF5697 family protein [Eubacteriales bacterium]|nr:DUF5697 family protein [Eubacteriales bacterium]
MKTRDEIYRGEAEALLHVITTYHALTYEQVVRTFPRKDESLKALIKNLIKQGRIYYDSSKNLLCDKVDTADTPDWEMISAYWVLLNFKKALVYHTSGDFPVKIHFFSNDEAYEIISVPPEQEFLLNHILAHTKDSDVNRLVIVSSKEQAMQIHIQNVVAFCMVDPDGHVSYYQKKER